MKLYVLSNAEFYEQLGTGYRLKKRLLHGVG
jgi:hypothetical protein